MEALAEEEAKMTEVPLIPRTRPARKTAEAAVRTLIEWTRDNPDREGLRGTPERVVRAYEEFFQGYQVDPVALLDTTFEEANDYDDMVVLRDIRVESHCEHHIVPILGKAHVAYLPDGRVVGVSSKQARTSCRSLRQTPANAGDHDRSDRRDD